MARFSDLARSGHWPSLLAAFLHFDVSFMVWVIMGALAPFIAVDPAVSGPSLYVTPLAGVSAGRYVLAISRPQPARSSVYDLAIETAGGKALETDTLDNARLGTLAAANRRSHLVRLALARPHAPAPAVQAVPLKAATQLRGAERQVIGAGLSAGSKGLLIALPLLAAGLFRIVLGMLSDRFGSRRVGIASMALTLLPLLIGWQWATSYGLLLCAGAFLGVAGASFAVALPLASRWYPPHMQGLALGIAGAGNSGTVMAALCAPFLAGLLGWHAVFGLLMVPAAATLIIFTVLARDAPGVPRLNPLVSYRRLLARRDTYVFCLFYFVTFGGFVGFSSFLNTFFVDQFHLAKTAAGVATVPFVVAGSLLRPVGGALADRFGGVRLLGVLYVAIAAALAGVAVCLSSMMLAGCLLFVAMGCLGMGNGSVFQLVPQRFRHEIGTVTGLVGAVGGVGGFYLNVALGTLKDSSGSYATGFGVFACTAMLALAVLRLAAPSWTWLAAGGRARTTIHESVPAVRRRGLEAGEAG